MSTIFHVPELQNKPSKSGFDLSRKNSFTAKIGEILPIWHASTLIGDKFKIQIQHLTRTMPLQTSAFTRFTEYFDFFFVPYSQLYRNSRMVLTEMRNNPQFAQSAAQPSPVGINLPWFNSADFIGSAKFASGTAPYLNIIFNDGTPAGSANSGKPSNMDYQNFSLGLQSLKLWNYLGGTYCKESILTIPNDSGNWWPTSRPYSLFPFAAYQKIYFDFYRFDQWENNAPQCYNFDYLGADCQLTRTMMAQMDKRNNIFTLRHSNYPKDLFFGMLPSPQYGDPAVAAVTYSGNSGSVDALVASGSSSGSLQVKIDSSITDDPSITSEFSSAISVLELRQAKALQRYREVIGTGSQDYRSMAKKIFGKEVPAHMSNLVQYLGGFRSTININDVVNQNLAMEGDKATIQGTGYGEDEQNKPISFEANDYGIIMCLYRVIPILDYALRAPHFDMMKTEVDDFANPFFDRLGLQELPSFYLDDVANSIKGKNLGYVPRYFEYKTGVDVVNGNFREQMSNWIAAVTPEYLSGLDSSQHFNINKDFFKVNSHLVDSIFFQESDTSVTSDQFLVNANIGVKAVRPLDYTGLPNGN